MEKSDRILEIFYRGIRGENLSVKALADEHGLSPKSISRDLSEIKTFLAEHRELVGNTELVYDYSAKVYRLEFEEFLLSKELIAIVKILLGSRALPKNDLAAIIEKLKTFTTAADQRLIGRLVQKELGHYNEVHHESGRLIDDIWRLTNAICARREITVTYRKMAGDIVSRRLRPASIMFSDYYFYLIAYETPGPEYPKYFRIDRITKMTEHRDTFEPGLRPEFDEGALREKIHLMFPGELMKITFEYTGPSVDAIKDKLPTARLLSRKGQSAVFEAEVYGDGIKMFLLSQGEWIRVLSPERFVRDMRNTLKNMLKKYE
ncbi:MAG: WYL domain-containing protein [Oscillospiraceae bacterium]|nr:WYL domain-containing protein [Oscillospiraceae bacterium]